MSEVIRLNSADRVLVFAPHPDDEAIACGGLLLAARDVGAARRVVTLTDGDNNPWPQRWIEKRWRIDATARTRWGARRRAESHAALDALGVAADERIYLGLADSGLTTLLMQDAEKLITPLREQVLAFRPTHLAWPALVDRHPDHSATHVATRLALLGADSPPQALAYRVHGGHTDAPHVIELTTAQCESKRKAIASHRTQVTLSGKRFLAFATPVDSYALVLHERTLHLRVRKQNLHGNLQVRILLADEHGETQTLLFPMDTTGKPFDVQDTHSNRIFARARWHSEEEAWALTLPLPEPLSAHLGFAKLSRRGPGFIVFDRFGWQTIAFD
jgi:LmbE family N-acetylglucosaminyl deacetylase